MYLTFEIIMSILIVLMAAVIAGLAGFGFSLVSVPLLVLVFPAKEVVPIIIALSIVLNLVLFLRTRENFEPRRIWPLILGSAFGIPVGIYLLLVAEAQLIKFAIGILIVIFGLALLFEVGKKVDGEKKALFPVGLASGVLNGSVSMSGPPVILFFQNQRFKKEEFRANLIGYFFALNIITLPFFLATGLLTQEVVGSTLVLVPGLVLGSIIGTLLAKNIDQRSFRRLTLLIIICAGVVSVTAGLGIFQ